ncbi:MAG TPA: hypothetical protein VFH06_00165 [Candidatus Saccharimonadales bacterium]|nr:hypothetical protein [Candidatus Saccharimonadales bacterium]
MREKPLAYLEMKRPPKTDTALASNIVHHWQTRHLYGKALVVSLSPEPVAKLIRKQWLSLLQSLQHERSRTIDADQLLQLTHSITRMQQMVVTIDAPHEFPAAHIWCITPEQLLKSELPRTCQSIYIGTQVSTNLKDHLYEILPAHSLVVDFAQNEPWLLASKSILDDKVHHAWEELQTFFSQHDIDIQQLSLDSMDIDRIDDALDALLDSSSSFLRHARHFQEALHLAQPLRPNFKLKEQYELANMLARRVAMLTPGMLHHSFIQSENDTFSLYDIVSSQRHTRESLTAMIARHLQAGRKNLARALETAFVNNTLTL